MRKITKFEYVLVGSAILLFLFMIVMDYKQTNHEEEAINGLQIITYLNGEAVELSLWKDVTDQRYYLFLPAAFANEKGVTYQFQVKNSNRFYEITINGIKCEDDFVWMDDKKEREHILMIRDRFTKAINGGCSYPLQVLVSEKIPTVMVTVENAFEILNPQNIDAQKHVENGYIKMWDVDGNLMLDNKMETFKVRGNQTATLSKKPFTFTLAEPVAIGSMEKAVKWNLLANATDGSYMRNKIMLDLAQKATSDYVPQAEYVDLFLNGQYYGMYLLTEAVEIDENRLDVIPEKSWFLELELDFRDWLVDYSFVSESGNTFAVHSEYIYDMSEKIQLENLVNRTECVILNAEDETVELDSVIDMDSWAYAWCIQEISGNCDVGLTSQFLYTKEKSDTALFYAGPVWDFDATMGNTYVAMFRVTNALTASIEETRDTESVNRNRWLAGMYRHESFRDSVKEKYELVFEPLVDEVLDKKIDEYVTVINRAATLDALRWNRERLGWQFVLPEGIKISENGNYHRFDTLEENVQMIRCFLEEKKEFLDKIWIDDIKFEIVREENTVPVRDSAKWIYKWVEQEEE